MITMKEIEEQIDVTTSVAKEKNNEWALLKSVNELKAKLASGKKAGLYCNEPRIKAKFAALQKACDGRLKKPKKSRVKK